MKEKDAKINLLKIPKLEENINLNSNKIGDLSGLTTTDKTSVVNAIKENTASLSQNTQQINNLSSNKADNTDNIRTTTAKDVTGAINELNSNKANKSALDTETTQRQANDSQLNARIDNIVASAGNGTIPTEVSDMRTNNWSDTFGASNGRVLFSEKLLDKLLYVPTFTITTGSYRNTSGGIATGSNICYTSPVKLKKGQTILVYADGQTSSVAILSKVRKTGTGAIISVLVNSTGSGLNYYYYTSNEDCYVSASFDNTKNYNVFVFYAPTTDMVTDTPISITLTDGYYINSSGAKVSNAGYSYSSPIRLNKNDLVTIKLSVDTNVAAISLCDSTGAKITPLYFGQGFTTLSELTYVAEEDCYIIICGGIAYDITVKVKSYGNLLSQYENFTTIVPTFVDGYYWSSKGNKVAQSGFSYSNAIKVKKGQRVKVYTMGYLTNVAIISTCDKNAIYTKPRTMSTDSLYRIYTYDVTSDGYITVCGVTGYISSVILEDINNPVNNIADLQEYLAYKNLFSKCICIGDSITYGYRDTQTSLPNKSYPVYLSNLSGWTIENAGVSGITAQGWWNTKAQTYNYANYDIAIIKLGQNEGLTDTLATDVTGTDYTTYANTNTGDYCKIIEFIKSQNSKIKIFLVGIQNPQDTTTNSVIQQIATKYSLPYLNLDVNGYQDLYSGDLRATYTTYYDCHFNTIGYITLAKVILNMICKYIADNQSKFSDII